MELKAKNKPKKINYKERLNDDDLDLSLCGLEVVPVKEISAVTKARKLNLSYNSLITLPDDFIKLSMIRELDLSKNHLKTLPKNFGALAGLKMLDLLGNNLTDLPSSFSELKNLQWLDMKDNPVNSELKLAVGECANENDCKKCARNVMKYAKWRGAEEDRQREIQLKLKREEERKQEELDKKEVEELKQKKKLEREEKNRINQERKKEMNLKKKGENSETFQKQAETSRDSNDAHSPTSSSFFSLLLKTIFYIFFLLLVTVSIYIISTNYCKSHRIYKPLQPYMSNQYAKQLLKFVNEKVCPLTKYKHPFLENLVKSINIYL